MKLTNLVCLVTGGVSGIGKAVAMDLAALNNIVYVCDLNEQSGKQIEAEGDGRIKFIKCNITNEAEVQAMVETIEKEQGRLEVCVNSAGIGGAAAFANSSKLFPTELYAKIIAVNLTGSFLVSKHAAKLMIKNAKKEAETNGVIIFLSSLAGLEGQNGQAAYSASKGALLGMTLPIARDLGKFKIRVNSICPGVIETPMTEGFGESTFGKAILNSSPLKAFGRPEHVSLTVKFMIENDQINGSYIRVDGGTRMPNF